MYQVETFRDDFGLTAVAINSQNGGCTPEVVGVCSTLFRVLHTVTKPRLYSASSAANFE